MEKNLDLGFEFVMVAEVNDVVAAVDQGEFVNTR
jgi:hypothetical protein